jgi:uracil-DNA glycosylase
MNLQEILGESWAARLPKAEELLTPIREQLNAEKQAGITIFPYKAEIFRVFRETPFESVKVVWLGQDPYHSPERQATGRAFECGRYPSPSWRKVSEVYKKHYNFKNYNEDVVSGTLDTWVEQGVFLINKALTVREKQPNSHTRIWEPFVRYAVSTLLTDLEPRAFILLGGEAQKMIPKVTSPHKGFYYEHPAAATYQQRKWDADDLFEKVSTFLEFHGKPITW